MSNRSVNGRTYYGVAKEKEAAAIEFESRLNAGENVGLVESRWLHNIACVSLYINIYELLYFSVT